MLGHTIQTLHNATQSNSGQLGPHYMVHYPAEKSHQCGGTRSPWRAATVTKQWNVGKPVDLTHAMNEQLKQLALSTVLAAVDGKALWCTLVTLNWGILLAYFWHPPSCLIWNPIINGALPWAHRPVFNLTHFSQGQCSQAIPWGSPIPWILVYQCVL